MFGRLNLLSITLVLCNVLAVNSYVEWPVDESYPVSKYTFEAETTLRTGFHNLYRNVSTLIYKYLKLKEGDFPDDPNPRSSLVYERCRENHTEEFTTRFLKPGQESHVRVYYRSYFYDPFELPDGSRTIGFVRLTDFRVHDCRYLRLRRAPYTEKHILNIFESDTHGTEGCQVSYVATTTGTHYGIMVFFPEVDQAGELWIDDQTYWAIFLPRNEWGLIQGFCYALHTKCLGAENTPCNHSEFNVGGYPPPPYPRRDADGKELPPDLPASPDPTSNVLQALPNPHATTLTEAIKYQAIDDLPNPDYYDEDSKHLLASGKPDLVVRPGQAGSASGQVQASRTPQLQDHQTGQGAMGSNLPAQRIADAGSANGSGTLIPKEALSRNSPDEEAGDYKKEYTFMIEATISEDPASITSVAAGPAELATDTTSPSHVQEHSTDSEAMARAFQAFISLPGTEAYGTELTADPSAAEVPPKDATNGAVLEESPGRKKSTEPAEGPLAVQADLPYYHDVPPAETGHSHYQDAARALQQSQGQPTVQIGGAFAHLAEISQPKVPSVAVIYFVGLGGLAVALAFVVLLILLLLKDHASQRTTDIKYN